MDNYKKTIIRSVMVSILIMVAIGSVANVAFNLMGWYSLWIWGTLGLWVGSRKTLKAIERVDMMMSTTRGQPPVKEETEEEEIVKPTIH